MSGSIRHGANKVGGAAASAASNPVLTGLARVGLISYGVVHILVAYIAVKIAWGGSAQSGDQSGALATLADDPVGRVLFLWVIAVGLFALVLWQLSQAIWGYQHEDGTKKLRHRLTAAGKGVLFAALAVSSIRAATDTGSSSTAQQQEHAISGKPRSLASTSNVLATSSGSRKASLKHASSRSCHGRSSSGSISTPQTVTITSQQHSIASSTRRVASSPGSSRRARAANLDLCLSYRTSPALKGPSCDRPPTGSQSLRWCATMPPGHF